MTWNHVRGVCTENHTWYIFDSQLTNCVWYRDHSVSEVFHIVLISFNQLENKLILLFSLFLYFVIISSIRLQYPKVLNMDSGEGLSPGDVRFEGFCKCAECENDMEKLMDFWKQISNVYEWLIWAPRILKCHQRWRMRLNQTPPLLRFVVLPTVRAARRARRKKESRFATSCGEKNRKKFVFDAVSHFGVCSKKIKFPANF